MKTEFNPKKIPSWCKWIAQDEDGSWWGFSAKPKICQKLAMGDNYYEWDVDWDVDWNRAVKLYKSKPPKNWKDELYSWGYV